MQNSRGISLPGMIAIIVILGGAAYFVVPHFLANTRQQNLAQIKQDITAIDDALDQYKLDNGNYPTTEQGLDALVNQPSSTPVPQYWNPKGYISPLPVDPWGQSYQYTNTDNVLRIFSYGSGGKSGNTEIDLANVDK